MLFYQINSIAALENCTSRFAHLDSFTFIIFKSSFVQKGAFFTRVGLSYFLEELLEFYINVVSNMVQNFTKIF